MPMRPNAAALSSSRMRPRATWRDRLRSIVSRPAASASGLISVSSTSSPANAQTWAMPRPIWPAPMTPMRRISGAGTASLIAAGSLLAFSELLLELRQDLEQVADQAVIGDLEDRRLLVLVDRDDDLGILHAGEMLNGARDADCDVQLGRDDLAG